MASATTARMQAQKENKLSTIDKTILDNFYKLVHTDQNIRLRASLSTYKILHAMKKNKPNTFNDQLNYCVERLVTGLASSRAMARRGYASLLLEILKTHQVSTERLLTIAQQKFGNISNETIPDNLFGYFLLVVVIIDSGNYKRSKQNTNSLDKMLKYLLQLIKMKSYFDYPVSKFLTEHYELFHPHLLANISPESFGTDVKISHTDLLILTLCNKKQPMRELTGLDKTATANLSKSLTDDRLHRRPLHPIWVEYTKILMELLPQHFETFYEDILAPTFFKPKHNDLAAMGLELIAISLNSANDPSILKTILSDYVIRLLILSQRSKSPLNNHCVTFFKTLSSSFADSLKSTAENNEAIERRQFCILNRFTSSPGSVAFDEDSKSTSIITLLNNCRPEVLNKYLEKLMTILGKEFTSTEESKRLHTASARQISQILLRPQMMEQAELTQRFAKFLMMNSLFDPVGLKSVSKDAREFLKKHNIPSPYRHLDTGSRTALKSAYHSAMDHLTSACSTIQRIESYNKLLDFAGEAIQLGLIDRENLKDLWTRYHAHLTNYRKLVKKSGESKILYPTTNLYLFYGLQILEHSLDCIEQLNELAASSEEALKNDPNDGSSADVLTDQIIAILSATECSPWIRKLCVSVFGSLLPHISETSIDLICDALLEPLGGEDECQEEESDGQDSDESEWSDAETSSEDEEDEQEEGEEEEGGKGEGEESKTEMEVEEENEDIGKLTINNGDATDDEDEEYLDDDQMMKLDSVMGDMFKMNRIVKKKRDPSFQLRVLDLVKKILAKKRNDAEVVKKILATIRPLGSRTGKTPELRPISTKINKMISKMRGKKALLGLKDNSNVDGNSDEAMSE